MKIRHIENRYSAAPGNKGPRERRKEKAMRICEKQKAYILVNTIKTGKCTNNWISSTKECKDFLHGA
jgi:hypothetical protein